MNWRSISSDLGNCVGAAYKPIHRAFLRGEGDDSWNDIVCIIHMVLVDVPLGNSWTVMFRHGQEVSLRPWQQLSTLW